MTKLKLRTPEYERLLTRWNELDAILYPTYRERVEKRLLGDQLAALEAEYDRRAIESDWRMVAEDFEEAMRWGDYGGVEG